MDHSAPAPPSEPPSQLSKKLQHETWEIELLISGGALFSLYQLSEFIVDTMERAIGNLPAMALASTMIFGLRMLSIFFAAHLCIRAFWLSQVLFKKVYPSGIDFAKLRLREPFLSRAAG